MPRSRSTKMPTTTKCFSLDAKLLGDFLERCIKENINHNRSVEHMMREFMERDDDGLNEDFHQIELRRLKDEYNIMYDNYMAGKIGVNEAMLENTRRKIQEHEDSKKDKGDEE